MSFRLLLCRTLPAVAAVAVCASSGLAVAQVPPSADPGIVSRSLERQDRSRGALGGDIVLPQMKDDAIEGSTEKVFTLSAIVVDDTTVYKPEDFAAITKEFTGQPVSFSDLSRIVNAMTRKYREDGYIFSRVVLPPQKVKDGVVHVRAVEGRIEKVEVTGTFKDSNGLIRAMADKIHSEGPTNARDIERYLLLIDDLPGITARSFVKPSATPGASDLVIVAEEDPLELSATLDNRGSRFVGPWRGEFVGAVNGIFGIHDRTTLRAIVASQTEELRYGEITHEEQLFAEGLRVKGRYAITSTEPGATLKPLGIVGDSELFDLEALYPVVRSRPFNITLNGGFNVNSSSTELSGILVGKDRIRSARLGAAVDFTDALMGVNQLDIGMTKGLRVLNATKDGIGRSRANGEHDFLRFNATATRVQDLWFPGLSAMLSATAQQTNDPLLSSEEFTVGGPSFGRAYDSGEIAGDKGYAGVVELRYGDQVSMGPLQSYQLYTYLDYGKVKNTQPVVGETVEDSLTSTGVGVRFNLEHDFSGYLELDTPLNKKVNAEGDKDTRVFGSITKRF